MSHSTAAFAVLEGHKRKSPASGNQTWKNELIASPQRFVLDRFFRGFGLGGQGAMPNEDAFVTDSSLPSRNERRDVTCKCRLDRGDANFVTLHRVWMAVSIALSQQGFWKQSSATSQLEADLPSENKVQRRTIRPSSKLKAMEPLESHLLLYMLNQLRIPYSLQDPSSTRRASICACSDAIENTGRLENAAEAHGLSLGLLMQTHMVSKLTRRLALGKSKTDRRKLSTLGFARLQGEPGFHPEVPWHLPLGALVKIIPQFRKVAQQQEAFPDKQLLTSVQDFFLYTEAEDRRIFQDLDRDKDGQITLDDLRVAMDKMKLPSFYAKKFLRSAHNHFLANSFGWLEFASLVQEKEPMMIRSFNSLGVTNSGTLQKMQVKNFLRNAGFPTTEANAMNMIRFLGVDKDGSIKYGQFRKFMLLVPTEQLALDPWTVWFRAATLGADTVKDDALDTACSQIVSFCRGLGPVKVFFWFGHPHVATE